MKRKRSLRWASAVLLPLLWQLAGIPPGVAQPASRSGVVYPDVRDPYRSIFESMVEGIRDEIGGPLLEYKIDEGRPSEHLPAWIAEHRLETLISLGKQGLTDCSSFPASVRLFVGAVLRPPQPNCTINGGVVLAPSPAYLFDELKELSPSIDQITVVYNPVFNEWLIEHAESAAQSRELTLNAIEAPDLQTAAQLYRTLISSGLGNNHAIWLPQDPYTVDEQVILPELLKASWNDGFIVFSSNPAHVSRGVLFALYPDHRALGRRLGTIARRVSSGSSKVKNVVIEPLRDLLIAVNLRTADHLRLDLSNRQISNFDLTFPASR